MKLARKEYGLKVIGLDEAGRGPLAGPVVAAAVVLPPNFSCSLIKDSKKLSPKKREEARLVILEQAEAWSIVAVGARRIDKINILRASLQAMSLASQRVTGDICLIDGCQKIQTEIFQETIISGDGKYYEIAAASILAKVYRDNLMKVIANKIPSYNFEQHFGYPTPKHKELLKEFGLSYIHRRSFEPCRKLSFF
jgi:ribonuclease HII